jgi:hypothetical protein
MPPCARYRRYARPAGRQRLPHRLPEASAAGHDGIGGGQGIAAIFEHPRLFNDRQNHNLKNKLNKEREVYHDKT